jgi:hypothetical protein
LIDCLTCGVGGVIHLTRHFRNAGGQFFRCGGNLPQRPGRAFGISDAVRHVLAGHRRDLGHFVRGRAHGVGRINQPGQHAGDRLAEILGKLVHRVLPAGPGGAFNQCLGFERLRLFGLIPQRLNGASDVPKLVGPLRAGHCQGQVAVGDGVHRGGKLSQRSNRRAQHQPLCQSDDQYDEQRDGGAAEDDRLNDFAAFLGRHADEQDADLLARAVPQRLVDREMGRAEDHVHTPVGLATADDGTARWTGCQDGSDRGCAVRLRHGCGDALVAGENGCHAVGDPADRGDNLVQVRGGVAIEQ